MFDLLINRRSIRNFQDKEVPFETLLKIVDIARHTPSGKNLQPWEFIIITDKSILNKLGEVRKPSSSPLLKAKAAIAVVTDPNSGTHLLDGACATLYLWLAATALGLGAVWINPAERKEMYEILKIPEGKHLLSILAIGWPAEEPKKKKLKELNEITHLNYYGNKLK